MSVRTKLLASSVAPMPVGSLAEPLIPREERPVESKDEGEETDAMSSVGFIIGAVLLGAAGIAASAAAFVSSAGMVVVYIAGGICIANSGTLVKNQYDISKGKGYRQGINSLRKEASRISEQTEHLVKAVTDLQTEADLMTSFEQQLSEIARKQGYTANEVLSLVKENEEILQKQKANLKQTFVSDMAKAFISSEFLSGDMKIDLKNLPVLMMRLQIQLNAHGMQLDDKKFEEMVRNDNDIGSILQLLGDILCAKESGDLDDSNAALNMITLDTAHSKGSVDVARGKASNLANKPRLEHRNTVVRDVKRGLSMRGIEIDSGSDSSVSSGYEQEQVRHGRRDAHGAATDIHPTRKHRQTAEQSQSENEETKPRSVGRFRAAARTAGLMASASNKDARKGPSSRGNRRASEDMDAASVSSKSTGKSSSSRRKFKSAAMVVASTSRDRRDSENMENASVSSKESRRRPASHRRISMDGLRSSFSSRGTKPASDDRSQSSGGSPMGKTRRKASGIPRSQSMIAEVALEQYTSKSVGERTRTRSSPGQAGSGRRRVRKGSF